MNNRGSSQQTIRYFLLVVLFVSLDAVAAPKLHGSSGKKKRTVEELLSQMKQSNRGGQVEMKKGSTSLPSATIPFQAPQNSGKNLEPVKPPRTSTMVSNEGGVKAEYERIVDKQIDELFRLTQNYKDSKNRGELWLRLAELYIEKATIIDTRKQDDFDNKLKAFQEGRLKTKPKLDTAEARVYNKKAIQLYDWFLRDFPRDPKIPQALFFLGFNYFELGQNDRAVTLYEDLVKRYPQSQYVQEAYFALGEHFFDSEKWVNSYKNYSQILKDKGNRLYTMALYKSAWTLYRIGKYKEALNYMEHIIKAGRQETGTDLATRKTVNRAKLEAEALRDIVIFYADVGDAKTAPQYLRNLVGEDVVPYLESLANYYNDRGDRDSAAIVLRQLIDYRPQAPKAVEYQYQIVQNYFYAKNSPRFRDELYRWIKDYGRNAKWAQANQANAELINNSYKLREQTLRNYIMQQHQTAQNSRAAYSQKQAMDGYQLYIQEFSDAKEYPNMRFYFGELLYDMGKYDEAGQQYNWVVQSAPDSKYFGNAATSLIHAVEKGMPPEKDLAKKPKDSLEPLPMDPRVDRFIKAGNWYVEKFPHAEKNVEIKFRIGRLYYLHNEFDKAMQVFKAIMASHPRTKYAQYSANLIVDIYDIKKDYVGMEKTGSELLAMPSIADSQAGSDIRDVLERSSFKKAQDFEGQKKYQESAQQFESFAKQNPKSDLVPSAHFNAAVNYERAGFYPLAVINYNKVISGSHKNSDALKLKSKRLLAKIYQDSGQFEAAAKLFRQVAEADVKDPLSQNLLFTSAVLFEALGRYDESAKSYESYLKNAKTNREKQEAIFAMASIFRKGGQKASAIKKYEEYIDSGASDNRRVMESQSWIMQLNREMGNKEEAQTWAKRIQGFHKRLSGDAKNSTAKYVAKAKIYLLQFKVKDYEALRLPENPQKLKRALDEKLEHLNGIKRAVGEIIAINSADEIVASLNQLGKAYLHMGEAISHLPAPRELSDEQKKEYREKVNKELVMPQLNQAQEAFKKAVLKAWELEVGGEDYRFALSRVSGTGSSSEIYDGGEVSLDNRFVNWMNE